MKRILILSLMLIILVSVLCIPSFALTTELPFVPASPHEHRFIDGVCDLCGNRCSHAQLDEATYVCVTCGMDFSSAPIASDDDGNELSFGGFLGLLGGAAVIFGAIYAVSILKEKRR